MVGMAVVVALLVAGMAQAPGQAEAGKALMPVGMLPLGFGPPQMPAASHVCPEYIMAPPGPGPAQVVKAMGAPGQAPAARGKYSLRLLWPLPGPVPYQGPGCPTIRKHVGMLHAACSR